MVDFIDPTLRSSNERKRLSREEFQPVFKYLLIFIVIGLIVWVGYSIYVSKLDTRPEDTINIDNSVEDINKYRGNDRLPSIPNTVE